MLRLASLASGVLGHRAASAVVAGGSRWPPPCLCESTGTCGDASGPLAHPAAAAGQATQKVSQLCPEAPSARAYCSSSSSSSSSSNSETNQTQSAGVGATPPEDEAQGQQEDQERDQQQGREQERQRDRQRDRQVQAAAEPQAESGQACESKDAAARDVLLSRVAALEAEVAALREAVGSRGKEGGGRGSGGEEDRGMRGDPHGTSLTGRPEGEQADWAGGGGEKGQEEGKDAGARGGGSEQGDEGGSGGSSGDGGKESGGEQREERWFGDGEGRREGGATEAAAESLAKLHPKITRLVQSGYLESLHHLRQRIMMDEWEGGGRQRALRRAVADLEAQLAERAEGGQGGQADGGQAGGDTKEGQQGGMALSWEELSELYKDPTNLSIIRDPRVRSTARAVLQRVLDERHEAVRKGATDLAKELADQVTKGPADLLSGLWGLLPLPAFLKGK